MRVSKLLTCPQLLFVLVLVLSAQHTYADHLKGGWIKYTYTGESNGTIQYHITFYQYSDCTEPDKVDYVVNMAVYDAGTSTEFTKKSIQLSTLTTQTKNNFGPCFNNPPTVCYLVAEYNTDISVPKNTGGYVLAVQRCCRIAGIENVPASNSVGITYTITIPGGSNINNNSPVFSFDDLIAICYSSPFSFDFSASDIDGDSLVYSLCSGLSGGTQLNPIVVNPPPPPYSSIPYLTDYSGLQPLGANVSIDPKTGIVSGRAPAQTGTYVVAVCINEFRNGVNIAKTRKELHLNVANCQLVAAALDVSYITCNGYDFTFSNNFPDNPAYSYHWDFGVTNSNNDTSSLAHPTFTYADTGVYIASLDVKNNLGCEDSAKTQVKIFPGFTADFSVDETCVLHPYDFTDLTTTKYGYENSQVWSFGDTLATDTTKNPVHTYATNGQFTATLIATNSKGCIDTAVKVIDVTNGPDVGLKFKDTLICSIDTLQLSSVSSAQNAVYSWSPSYNIIGSNTNQPLVFPKQTSTYNVTVSYKGCVTQDSVTVNVTNQVTLQLPADTSICKTDSINLLPVTNALYFLWTPATGLSSSVSESPGAAPLSNTTYTLFASIGKCSATGAMNVNVVPYPSANAGADVSICYGKTTQLHADITGANFSWSPASGLVNSNTLSPVAGPQATTKYTIYATDTLGCPKPVYDTVLVTVIPKVAAFAGNDTIVTKTQPLQLNAKGGTSYQWTPASNLNNPLIADPIAVFTDGPDTITYNVRVSTPEGCYANDSIKIFIFETKPEVFIPTAFTPNADGRNDVFRATVAGMKQFLYFRIYNRWGQLLFSTSEANKGWDGVYDGIKQASGTYVYVIEAIDFTGKPYLNKGSFVLIR